MPKRKPDLDEAERQGLIPYIPERPQPSKEDEDDLEQTAALITDER